MLEERNMEAARDVLTRHYGVSTPGQVEPEVELIAPVLGGLMNTCYLDEIAPIIMELLNDDSLVAKITEIYERGYSLWSALEKKEVCHSE